MPIPHPEEVQRWTAKRKAAIVLDLIAGKTTSAEVARSHGLTLSEVEKWKANFIAQGTESLRSHRGIKPLSSRRASSSCWRRWATWRYRWTF